MISVNKIKYNNVSSLDFNGFNLITCLSFEGDSGDVGTFLNREAVASESYRGHFKRVHNYKYNEVLAPTFTFIKDDFADFTMEEHRTVFKWLTSKDTASFLTVYHDDSEVISYEILGGFTEINTHKLGSGRIVGITAVFESVAPWAFSPLYTIEKNVSNPANNKITIDLETDDPQSAVYPRVTIRQHTDTHSILVDHAMGDTDNWVDGSVFKYNGTYYWVDSKGEKHTATSFTGNFNTTSVSIRNTHTDDNDKISVFNTLVKHNVKGEIVVLDGANRVILTSSENRIFGDDFSWDWIPLYEGKNELSFIGNCTVTIEYRTPIKCGEF